jgi:streptogrisin D
MSRNVTRLLCGAAFLTFSWTAAQAIDINLGVGNVGIAEPGGNVVDAEVNLGNTNATADVNLGSNGLDANVNANTGLLGQPTTADVNVNALGSRGVANADANINTGLLGGADANASVRALTPDEAARVNLGITLGNNAGGGAGGGGGGNGGSGGGNGPGLDPDDVANAIDGMSPGERMAARRQCSAINANPGGYEEGLVALCAALARL